MTNENFSKSNLKMKIPQTLDTDDISYSLKKDLVTKGRLSGMQRKKVFKCIFNILIKNVMYLSLENAINFKEMFVWLSSRIFFLILGDSNIFE